MPVGEDGGLHGQIRVLVMGEADSFIAVSVAITAVEGLGQILEDSLTPAGIDQWLRSRNRMLGGRRPLDLMDEGDSAVVREAARAFVDGAYV
jgi:hypothetical protein